jgi:hypothetical protein
MVISIRKMMINRGICGVFFFLQTDVVVHSIYTFVLYISMDPALVIADLLMEYFECALECVTGAPSQKVFGFMGYVCNAMFFVCFFSLMP